MLCFSVTSPSDARRSQPSSWTTWALQRQPLTRLPLKQRCSYSHLREDKRDASCKGFPLYGCFPKYQSRKLICSDILSTDVEEKIIETNYVCKCVAIICADGACKKKKKQLQCSLCVIGSIVAMPCGNYVFVTH